MAHGGLALLAALPHLEAHGSTCSAARPAAATSASCAEAIPLTVLINPVVTPLSTDMEDGWEGCLSVPDMRGVVPRHTAVRLEAYDREGNRIDVVAKVQSSEGMTHRTFEQGRCRCGPRVQPVETCSVVQD